MRETTDTDKVGVVVVREEVAGKIMLSCRGLGSTFGVMPVSVIDMSDPRSME